jgi:hypothetical protein
VQAVGESLVWCAIIIGACVSAAKPAKHLSCENDQVLLRFIGPGESVASSSRQSTLAALV